MREHFTPAPANVSRARILIAGHPEPEAQQEMTTGLPQPGHSVLTDKKGEEAIATALRRKLLLTATFNRGRSVLAPHSIFERHGEPYLLAVTVERDGRKPRQARLGTFKLSGFSDLELTRRLFSRSLFDRLEEMPAPAGTAPPAEQAA